MLAACYLLARRHLAAAEVIARVRAARSGAIATLEQEAGIRAYADALAQTAATP